MANYKSFLPAAWSNFVSKFKQNTALVVDSLPTATAAMNGQIRLNRADNKTYRCVNGTWTDITPSVLVKSVSTYAELSAALYVTPASPGVEFFVLKITATISSHDDALYVMSPNTYIARNVNNNSRSSIYEIEACVLSANGNNPTLWHIRGTSSSSVSFTALGVYTGPTFWLDSDFKDMARVCQNLDVSNTYMVGRWAGGSDSADGWYLLGRGDDSDNLNALVVDSSGLTHIWINPDIMNQDLESTVWEDWAGSTANVRMTKAAFNTTTTASLPTLQKITSGYASNTDHDGFAVQSMTNASDVSNVVASNQMLSLCKWHINLSLDVASSFSRAAGTEVGAVIHLGRRAIAAALNAAFGLNLSASDIRLQAKIPCEVYATGYQYDGMNDSKLIYIANSVSIFSTAWRIANSGTYGYGVSIPVTQLISQVLAAGNANPPCVSIHLAIDLSFVMKDLGLIG